MSAMFHRVLGLDDPALVSDESLATAVELLRVPTIRSATIS